LSRTIVKHSRGLAFFVGLAHYFIPSKKTIKYAFSFICDQRM
jgi:hypothetical protein